MKKKCCWQKMEDFGVWVCPVTCEYIGKTGCPLCDKAVNSMELPARGESA